MGLHALQNAPARRSRQPTLPADLEKRVKIEKTHARDFFLVLVGSTPAHPHSTQCFRPQNPSKTTKRTPGLPVWPNRDPIAERGGIILYRFVRNSTANLVDYLGKNILGIPGMPDPNDPFIHDFYDFGKKDNSNMPKPPAAPESDETKTISYKDFLEELGIEKDSKEAETLARGCVGLACLYQGNSGKTDHNSNPVFADNTTCYLTEPEANKHKCKKGEEPFVFAFQGRWLTKDGKAPDVGADGAVNKYLISRTLTGGPFNFVTRFDDGKGGYYYVDANTGVFLNNDEDPSKINFFINKIKQPSGYSAEVWCVTCKLCK